MDKALYTGMSGAMRSMQAQAVHAHNLANATTTGFRADLAQAVAMQVSGDGLDTRVLTRTVGSGSDFSQGVLQETGNGLDLAIKGEGWIAVQADDGREAYTRAGNLQITPFGELLTGNGLPVLGNSGPVSLPPFEQMEIGLDGTISVQELGQGAEVLAALDRIKLVNPDNAELEKGADGLFYRRDGLLEPAAAEVRLVSGYLEGSNVNIVEAMVEMISLTRNYEMNVNLMQTLQENSEISAQLLQVQ